MKNYYGGEPVQKGTYLGLTTGEFVQAYGEEPTLPGERDTKFLKVPGALPFVAGPIIALTYIIFLPATGFAGLIVFMGYKIKTMVVALGRRVVQRA